MDRTTRAAKDLVRRIKTAQKQAKVATELWQAVELKLATFEQNLPQQQLLSLPAPTTEALPDPSTNQSLSDTIPRDDDLAHQKVATVEASTLTDSIQKIEANTLTDSIQTIDACTITESIKLMEVASPHPQPIHNPTPLLPPLVIVDKVTQIEAPFPLPTKQAATKTGPLLRDYRVELKAEIARSARREQWQKEAMARLQEQASSRVAELKTHAEYMLREHNEAMGRFREQAANKENEFKQRMEEYLAALKEKEKQVLGLQAALDYAKEWNHREDERNCQREEALIAENALLWS